jgi:hypothetical protein
MLIPTSPALVTSTRSSQTLISLFPVTLSSFLLTNTPTPHPYLPTYTSNLISVCFLSAKFWASFVRGSVELWAFSPDVSTTVRIGIRRILRKRVYPLRHDCHDKTIAQVPHLAKVVRKGASRRTFRRRVCSLRHYCHDKTLTQILHLAKVVLSDGRSMWSRWSLWLCAMAGRR